MLKNCPRRTLRLQDIKHFKSTWLAWGRRERNMHLFTKMTDWPHFLPETQVFSLILNLTINDTYLTNVSASLKNP